MMMRRQLTVVLVLLAFVLIVLSYFDALLFHRWFVIFSNEQVEKRQQQTETQEQGPPLLRGSQSSLLAANEEEEDRRPTIAEIMKSTGTDKYWSHRYDHYYSRWFAPFRDKPVKFLEIGADKGKSLRLWSEYFSSSSSHPPQDDPQAESSCMIVGLAYGVGATGVEEKVADLTDTKNVFVIRGDQSSKETMDVLIEKGPWDIIIDDGSHFPAHMVFSLFSLFQKAVKPGGLYVIEDLETNYWPAGANLYGYTYEHTGISSGPEHNAVAKLKQLIDVLQRYPLGIPDKLSVMPGDNEICEMSFGMNLVMFRKCNQVEMNGRPQTKTLKINDEEFDAWIQDARRSNPERFK